MFRVSQHPSSGVLKTVTGTGHNIGTATSLQRGLIGTDLCESYYFTSTTLPVLLYQYYITGTNLPASLYQYYFTGTTTLPVLHYRYYFTSATLPVLFYQYHCTGTTLPVLLLYQYYVTGTTLPVLLYQYYFTSNTLPVLLYQYYFLLVLALWKLRSMQTAIKPVWNRPWWRYNAVWDCHSCLPVLLRHVYVFMGRFLGVRSYEGSHISSTLVLFGKQITYHGSFTADRGSTIFWPCRPNNTWKLAATVWTERSLPPPALCLTHTAAVDTEVTQMWLPGGWTCIPEPSKQFFPVYETYPNIRR